MILLILLLVMVVSQLVAAVAAMRLIRTTKYSASWILIAIGLTIMALTMMGLAYRKAGEIFNIREFLQFNEVATIWLALVMSLCFAVGVLLIRSLLRYTALKEQQQRQREERTLAAIIKAEEEQRQHLAKEIHDGIGPLLSSAKLSVSALTQRVSDDTSREIALNAQQAIALAITSVRDISNNLSPHILNNFGIVRAVSSFLNRLRPVVDAQLNFETNIGGERFSNDAEMLTYRVVSELVNNSVRHSGATEISLVVNYHRHCLHIWARDNGCGFDPAKQSEGMGLSNIRSRIGSVKGNITIRSTSGTGTTVAITIPASTKS